MRPVHTVSRSRTTLWCLTLMLVIVISLAGCGGGDGGADNAGDGGTQVYDNATVVPIDSGGFIEVPEGALPEGAEVSVESTRMPLLPDDVEPLGQALAISATAELAEPAILHLPVPEGAGNESSLVIIRVEPDGTTTFLMTSVEGGELVAATPGFSTFSMGAIVNGVEMLMKGPSDLLTGQRMVYEARGFGLGRLTDTEWGATGTVTLIESSGQSALVEAGETTGTGWVTFQCLDFARGARFYGAKRVWVADSATPLIQIPEFMVHLVAPHSVIYAGVDTAQFTALVDGTDVKPPITWTWDFGDETTGGPVTTEGTTYTLPRKDYALPESGGGASETEYTAKITATDNQGHTGSDTYLIHVQREPLAVAIEGTQRLAWSPPSLSEQYTATVTGGKPPHTLSWSLSPGAWSAEDGGTGQAVPFDQPGEHRLEVKVVDDNKRSAKATLPIMVEGGEPLSTHMLDLPASAEVGEVIIVSVQARGGVLLVSGKKAGYDAEIDWDDGTVETVKDIGLARTPYEGTSFPISHDYAEPDTYTVTVTVWDATGTSAEDSREIAIEEAVNTPPVADPKTVTTAQDKPAEITLSGSDGDGDTLTYAVKSQPTHGSLSGAAPDLTYTPDTGYQGSDSFTYTASDGQTDSAAATVSITVTEETNTSPAAESITTSTTQETAVPVTLKGSDADGDELTYSVVGRPGHGGLTGTAPFLTYTPYSGYSGSDSFTYKVNDGRADSETATVSITIDPLRWVRVGAPVTNSADEPTEFYGGGSTPYYFGEPRFEGKFTIYSVSATSISVDDRDVDHGFEYYNVTVSSSFDAPPEVLIPGESHELTVEFTHSGTVVEGNPGARFEYRADKSHSGAIKPYESFLYAPWSSYFDGTASHTWTLTVPQAHKGDVLEVYAFWWNCPACNVTWTYQAE